MQKVAVFVDAGYLFAQGSACISGAKRQRIHTELNEAEAIAALIALAARKSDGGRLLRVYWYDGAFGSRGPTLEQSNLAFLDNVKLRLGAVNSVGEQKGVDSLIVTDLIELARNQSISDALLLSGDEDVRIGVLLAQNFGVRVHLLGIQPSRGSQSIALIQEADTSTEWGQDIVSTFLKVKLPPPVRDPIAPFSGATVAALQLSKTEAATAEAVIARVVDDLLASLDQGIRDALRDHWASASSIPSEFDGKLLARCREQLGRDITAPEKQKLRSLFRAKGLGTK